MSRASLMAPHSSTHTADKGAWTALPLSLLGVPCRGLVGVPCRADGNVTFWDLWMSMGWMKEQGTG